MRTLVLNAGYEPLQLISWERALCLVFAEKAEIVAHYSAVARSVSRVIKLPSVVRLVSYVQRASRFAFVRCSRRNVLLRDRYQCQYCGIACRPGAISIDHVTARSRGGKTTWTNVVAACHACNRRKGSRTPEEAGMLLMRPPRRPAFSELWTEATTGLSQAERHDWLPYLKSSA